MSGFGFTEAQEMYRREVHTFLAREIAPGASARARLDYIPAEIWTRWCRFGATRLNLPEGWGGYPADWVTAGIALEEVAAVDYCLYHPTMIWLAAAGGLALAPQEVQQEWVPRLISGEHFICLAITEPDAGSDAAAIKTRAQRDGDSYIITGEKTSISQGYDAHVAMLFAKTDPTARSRGISCFLVPLDSPGVHRSRIPTMGYQPVGTASIILDGVRVPARYRIGDEGQGFYLVMGQFDFMRSILGLVTLGAARASLEEAMAYAKARTAFGKPIARFEGVSFKIAEAATMIEAGRLLCYRALSLKDQGLPHAKESAMAKLLSVQTAVAVIHDCLLIHGQLGYSQELPLEQRLRNVIGLGIGDGTTDIMRVIISRELLGREFLPY